MKASPFFTINPYNQSKLAEYYLDKGKDVESKIARSHAFQKAWEQRPLERRCQAIERLAQHLSRNKGTLATLIATEMGKPVLQARAEVAKCAEASLYFAKHAPSWLAAEAIPLPKLNVQRIYQPLGCVLGIMPWNFPIWQVIRFAVPTLLSGNSVIVKHSLNTMGCGLALEQAFAEALGEVDAYLNLIVDHHTLGTIIEDRRIQGVSLTGSSAAGKAVGSRAGKSIKAMVLELGGTDPYLILEDADIELASQRIAEGRLLNAGQSCISPKRIFVPNKLQSAFVEAVSQKFANISPQDPLQEHSKLGPLARCDLKRGLDQQVRASVAKGAELAAGVMDTEHGNAHFNTIVLNNIRPGMPAFDEELFGPVVSICPYQELSQAVSLANQSAYGLGGGIFGQDPEQMRHLAFQLQVGTVAINDFVRSHPAIPFGGVKDSGLGRELSYEGMRAFCNIKAITVAS